ncbi:TYR [Ectocarpus sp. CCAP 1310/34]|nr:TYR [Ectocarpus sp. CCAP 1310/34]
MAETNPIGSAHVPRHLRALGGRSYGGKYGQHPYPYASIDRELAAAAVVGDDEARRETMNIRSSSRRGLAAAAVCVGFVAAVTLFARVDPQQSTGSSYRGVLKLDKEGRSVRGGSSSGLTLVATNEYGEYDRGALALYGFEMLVEPYKETTISVTGSASSSGSTSYTWLLVREDDDEPEAVDLEIVEQNDAPSGSSVKVTLIEAGATYSLRVQQRELAPEGGGDASVPVVVSEKTIQVTCRHVRRELRDLTSADRTAFFSAMREFYTVNLEAGKEKYGKTFANSKIMSTYHNSRNYCFHSGMHFLNAHASFDLWAERSLQMIDPTVAMHYWDFTIDAATLGPDWADSVIFSNDMYGSALGSPDNGYQISEGWFADVKSIYDPDETFLQEQINPGHSVYGYIDARYNIQAVDGVARTASYCGVRGELEFATCNVLINCFEQNDNISEWNECMENQVHAANHGMMGGAFNCNVDMVQFQEDHPVFKAGLLSFALEYILVGMWPSNSFMKSHNTCDTSCTVGQTQDCGCTCDTDFYDWSDDEVYDLMESQMETMNNRAHGNKYVYRDLGATYQYGFQQDGVRLEHDDNMLLMRTLLTLGCEPGALGAMSVGPSILDPVFWALHPIFEKATQLLQLSPTYKDTYDFTWVGIDCGDGVSGGQVDETMPFTERDFGFGDGDEPLTNQEIIDFLFPTNPRLPYVYDKFDSWGVCTDWDFEVAAT